MLLIRKYFRSQQVIRRETRVKTMRKKVELVILIHFLINLSYGQKNQLSKEQKVNDFTYAYEVLKENYPFFGSCARQYNIDWLARKEEYIALVKGTSNDSAYILTLKHIFDELNDGHVNFNATRFGNEGYYKTYKKIAAANPHYTKWVEIFENQNSRIGYWAEILKNAEKPSIPEKVKMEILRKDLPNYSDTLINDGEIAIMTIRSFSYNRITEDKADIEAFLNKISNSKYLIIDIQENGGGAVKYWKENIVERLITDTLIYASNPIIKDGSVNRHFYEKFFNQAMLLRKTAKLQNIPDELLREKFYTQINRDTLAPNSSFNFKGNVFLLVSKKVFSSSEGFAQFCKTTGWATVAGERTGGDGIGSDPSLILLPESGIIMGFPSLVGLNHDGCLNSEEKTTPDIEIYGANPGDRMEKLIRYLEEK